MKARIGMNAAQRKEMNREIQRQLAEYDSKNELEIEALVLWTLHEQYGFGKKRLRRFYDSFSKGIAELVKRYELDPSDDVWLCTRKLKDAGIDIYEWSQEDNNNE